MFSKTKFIASTAVVCFALATPALAQSGNSEAAGAQKLVNHAATAIHNLRSNADFAKLLRKAKGVFLVPTLAKGALVVGGSGGTGVLLVRHDGQWSDPAFFTLGSISIGAQAGGKAGPVAMFLMTKKAVADFTQHNNFSINGNANLTIAKWAPNAQGSIGKGDVVVWSGASGLFAGLDLSGSDIVADTKEDQAYYKQSHIGTKQIVDGQVTNQQAGRLVTELPS